MWLYHRNINIKIYEIGYFIHVQFIVYQLFFNKAILKNILERIKRQAIVSEKIFQIMNLIKDLYPEYLKNSQNSIIRKQPNKEKGRRFDHILHQRR